jgi:hypothetical protein
MIHCRTTLLVSFTVLNRESSIVHSLKSLSREMRQLTAQPIPANTIGTTQGRRLSKWAARAAAIAYQKTVEAPAFATPINRRR